MSDIDPDSDNNLITYHLEELPIEILFNIFDRADPTSLFNLLSTNKNLYTLVRSYFGYNKIRYKNIKLINDPNFHNKKDVCLICGRYVKVSSKKINSPNRRLILSCCGKRYIPTHYNCFNKLLMTIKCGDCGHVFRPDSLKNVKSLNRVKKFQYNVDVQAFIVVYVCLRALEV